MLRAATYRRDIAFRIRPSNTGPGSLGAMPHTSPVQTARRRLRPAVLVAPLLVLAVVVAALLGSQRPSASAPPSHSVHVGPGLAPVSADAPAAPGADGTVADGVTVFDDDVPAVANLDAGLLDALRRAATDAAPDGITFFVNSGWRSPEYQDQLLRDAVAEYGSAEEAARWVATADTSPHVQGQAIDLGDWNTTAWLSTHGSAYGLCQIYGNEPWHYELRPDAVGAGCPTMYADPTHDPRMQP